jgi:hypothetical protein
MIKSDEQVLRESFRDLEYYPNDAVKCARAYEKQALIAMKRGNYNDAKTITRLKIVAILKGGDYVEINKSNIVEVRTCLKLEKEGLAIIEEIEPKKHIIKWRA